MTKPNQLPTIMQQDLGYNPEGKSAFAKEAKRQLCRLARALDLSSVEREIRYNEGGIAVSGEATLHSDSLYVQICESFGPGSVMYRSCNGRNDYSGGQNHFIDEGVFDNDRFDEFVSKLKHLCEKQVVNG